MGTREREENIFFLKGVGGGGEEGCWSERYIAVVVLVGAAEYYVLIAIRKY